MIYPTARAIVLAALGAPAALLIGVLAPGLWLLGPGWVALVFALVPTELVRGYWPPLITAPGRLFPVSVRSTPYSAAALRSREAPTASPR